MLGNDIKCFKRRSCPKQDKKTRTYEQRLTVLNIKNCVSKLSIKMFVKRIARAGKACAYRMVVSFKTPVKYKNFFKLHVGQLCPFWNSSLQT